MGGLVGRGRGELQLQRRSRGHNGTGAEGVPAAGGGAGGRAPGGGGAGGAPAGRPSIAGVNWRGLQVLARGPGRLFWPRRASVPPPGPGRPSRSPSSAPAAAGSVLQAAAGRCGAGDGACHCAALCGGRGGWRARRKGGGGAGGCLEMCGGVWKPRIGCQGPKTARFYRGPGVLSMLCAAPASKGLVSLRNASQTDAEVQAHDWQGTGRRQAHARRRRPDAAGGGRRGQAPSPLWDLQQPCSTPAVASGGLAACYLAPRCVAVSAPRCLGGRHPFGGSGASWPL